MYISFKIIGQNIRCARDAQHLTQESLADKIGMSQLHFGRLERGERPASLEQIAHIADVLNTSTFSLLDGCLTEEPLCAQATEESRDFADTLARMSAKCSQTERDMMIGLCEVVSRYAKQ